MLNRWNFLKTGFYEGIKIRYSEDVDALLVEISHEPIAYAEESGPFIVHLSKDGRPVLLEILGAKEFVLGSLSSVVKGTESDLA